MVRIFNFLFVLIFGCCFLLEIEANKVLARDLGEASATFPPLVFTFGLPDNHSTPNLTLERNKVVCDGRYVMPNTGNVAWLAHPLILYIWDKDEVIVKTFGGRADVTKAPRLALCHCRSSSASEVWCIASDGKRNTSATHLIIPAKDDHITDSSLPRVPTASPAKKDDDDTLVMAILCIVAADLIFVVFVVTVSCVVVKSKLRKKKMRTSPLNPDQPNPIPDEGGTYQNLA